MSKQVERGLSVERLRELLEYDPEAGLFRWKVQRFNRSKGWFSGSRHIDGYTTIKLIGTNFLAHRLAYAITVGRWPEHQVDHRDLNRANNKWSNLRAATHAQNVANRRSRTSQGLKGAIRVGGSSRWRAIFNQRHLGYFATPEEAHAAYVAASTAAFGEFARAA